MSPEARCRLCAASGLRPVGTVAGYPFVECPRCAFIFTPILTQEAMERLYRSGYHGPAEGAPVGGWADPSFLGPALELLAGRHALRILDFGTGQSRVPDALRAEGHRVIAVDMAPPLEPHPDRLTGSLPSLGLEAGQFDLAFAFQVFEHLPEPRPFLQELVRLTRPGGLVLVHTDMETPERGDDFTRWWYVLPPDHCSFFRHRSFEVLLENGPHRIVWRDPKTVIVEVGGEA